MAHNPSERVDKYGIPHRTPIQEAETPQPRAPAIIDHTNQGAIDRLEDKLSDKLHLVEDKASRAVDKLKAKAASIGHSDKPKTTTTAYTDTRREVRTAKDAMLGNLGTTVPNPHGVGYTTTVVADQDFTTSAGRPFPHKEEGMIESVKNKLFGNGKKTTSTTTASEGYPLYTPDGVVKVSDEGTSYDSATPAVHTSTAKHDFVEGAEKAKDEGERRFKKLAGKTKHKLDEALELAHDWEKQSKEEISNAWESAKTHTQQIIQQYESRPVAHNLDEALSQVKKQNQMWQTKYTHDICDRHPNRTECYGAVQKLIQLAKENARINLDLATKTPVDKD